MKKTALFGLFVCCLFAVWCGNLQENESIYDWILTVAGVGPEISLEPTAEEWTLILKLSSEDRLDHLFFPQWIWEDKFNSKEDYLPWNRVEFKWIVKFLDWAAGNHYYEVKRINSINVISYPNAEDIQNLFDNYNYCAEDSDCGYFAWVCPLWCYITMNKKFVDISSSIVNSFANHLGDNMCVYDCAYLSKSRCENNKCVMNENYNPIMTSNAEKYECSIEEKEAEACTMQYEPVCWSDWKTYGNSCSACGFVDSYTKWECSQQEESLEENWILEETE